MTLARVAGEDFELDAHQVERTLAGVDPEPIREHYVVVGARRYPPKQVMAMVTGLDRADFTTHQARSILRRLGFGVYRRQGAPPDDCWTGAEPTLSARVGRLGAVRGTLGRAGRQRDPVRRGLAAGGASLAAPTRPAGKGLANPGHIR